MLPFLMYPLIPMSISTSFSLSPLITQTRHLLPLLMVISIFSVKAHHPNVKLVKSLGSDLYNNYVYFNSPSITS
ncbi:hypothetical protein RHMOL_Rhmol01G0304000 [Rhododendron molle]|uniref:Uncharacterized protein n=1 Tax=Rhododendron molle TaxID=49168 RepID=A0ACC0Q965_RHOML|nr:hypothetical protein RHMOL_Rhmol01G0304000 [Rhododendron molle]